MNPQVPADDDARKRAALRNEFIKDRDQIQFLADKYGALARTSASKEMKDALMFISEHLATAAKGFGGR